MHECKKSRSSVRTGKLVAEAKMSLWNKYRGTHIQIPFSLTMFTVLKLLKCVSVLKMIKYCFFFSILKTITVLYAGGGIFYHKYLSVLFNIFKIVILQSQDILPHLVPLLFLFWWMLLVWWSYPVMDIKLKYEKYWWSIRRTFCKRIQWSKWCIHFSQVNLMRRSRTFCYLL